LPWYNVHLAATQTHMQSKNRVIALENALGIYYEKHVHKKFLADVYAVIPKGRKCVMWFTHKQCWMFQIAKRPYQSNQSNQNQSNQTQCAVSFDDVRMISMPCMDYAWYSGEGTILHGTCVSDKKLFCVENVHYFCGVKQQHDGSMDHFIAFFDSYAKQKCKMETVTLQLQFFMPIMQTSFNAALKDAMQITTYDVFCIQHRFLKRPCTEHKNLLIHLAVEQQSHLNQTQSQSQSQSQTQSQSQSQSQTQSQKPLQPTQSFFPRQAHAIGPSIQSPLRTFILRPDVQNDIYFVLHHADEPITDKTMITHIPNYKTSVMMNSIFRNIKENRNLDALEESDDEEEFVVDHNDAKNKHVDLNKCVRMTCAFNHRFKRWQPSACA